MASVNFEKIKNVQQLKSYIRHCDRDERKKLEHSNKNIDKSKTDMNLQTEGSYEEICKKIDEKMSYFDSLEGQNKRKDRVIGFGMDIPIPDEIPDDKLNECCSKIINIINREKGKDNFISAYIHLDEVHSYKDAETGQDRESMRHIQAYSFCADENGKLKGRQFSSKKNMIKLNKEIHAMMQRDYGVDFMNGTQKKSKATVEYLKNKSERLAMREEVRQELREEFREDVKSDFEKNEEPKLRLKFKKQLKDDIKVQYEELYKKELKDTLRDSYEAENAQLMQDLLEQKQIYENLYSELSKEKDERAKARRRAVDTRFGEIADQYESLHGSNDFEKN